jgi:methylamine dehydrogenase accessory protein MauD
MNLILVISNLVLWPVVLFLGFLLLGALRAQVLLRWRLEQLEATTPSRLGRSGLKTGKKAPDFSLPSLSGGDVALRDFTGRKVLLVFAQGGCQPCHHIIPELNELAEDQARPVVVFNGDLDSGRRWAAEAKARMPVLIQDKLAVSRRYEVFATPFAFLIDEQGIIASKGIINNKQQIGFVLTGHRPGSNGQPQESHGDEDGEPSATN